MRPITTIALLLSLPLLAQAAPTWQTVSAEPGKRIEVDRTTLKREEGNKVVVQGRLVLDKPLLDPRSGSEYQSIEALTRYDCSNRNAATLKRSYRKKDGELLREEELNPGNLPVRAGTLDDKVLREVCRPEEIKKAEKPEKATKKTNQAEAASIAQKASAVAGPLRAANQALLHKEAPAHAAAAAHAPAAHTPPARKTPAHAYKETASPAHPTHIHWSYDGAGAPENWHKIDPQNHACGTGQRQSPIDIREGIPVDLDPIRFDYRPARFNLIDNGHTVQANLSGNRITLTGTSYDLLQLHFHRPSEEKIAGKRYDMVAHLVHKSDEGKLAVIAVLLERGTEENPVIQTLWNHLPLEKGLSVSPPEAAIDLNKLLPADKKYFTFMGSLTTPPCTEGVLWLVLRQPVSISPAQYDIFGRLYRNNVRPIQPLNGRLIKENR